MSQPSIGPADPEQLLREWGAITAAVRAEFDQLLREVEHSLTELGAQDLRWAEVERAHADAQARLAQVVAGLRARWTGAGPVLEEAVIRHSVNSARHLRWRVAEARRSGDTLARSLEQRAEEVLVRVRAAAARAVFSRAAAEWSAARACPECGEPFQVGGLTARARFRCGACGAEHSQDPGPATLDWISDGGPMEAVCDEDAAQALSAVAGALHTFRSINHPTVEDHAALATTARSAWLRWLDQLHRLRPTMDDAQIEDELQRRLGRTLAETTHSLAVAARKRRSEGVRLAKAGDVNAVMAWLERTDVEPAELVGQLVSCLHEHGDRAEAWQILALEHHVAQVAEDRDAWMRRRLGDLDDALATR